MYFAFPSNAFNQEVIVSGTSGATEMIERRCWPPPDFRPNQENGKRLWGLGRNGLPHRSKPPRTGTCKTKWGLLGSAPASWEPGWSEEVLGMLCGQLCPLCSDNRAHCSAAQSHGSRESNQITQCPGWGQPLHSLVTHC